MPRPEQRLVKLTIDGREVEAVEGSMLVDAAKRADIEIPFFCYEPKLGEPVGACRMCMVEIEGIPKLQTSCSTAVRDGMVVTTQSDRVVEAQRSVVEFLLVNHPLDCPVCDKGGECPLQDITFGWGSGLTRVVEPKRHFVKPLALSPLIAIDRERCILCYRCVRFSQEISEDWQLIFTDRGADTFVGTHDGHPYVAPFSGNIIELCPVGALTSRPYRFRARPWDIEGAGGVCTLCPSQCNVEFTVRDDRVARVLSRENDGVDDGWLCDKGRFAYQAIHVEERLTQPLVRVDGSLRPASWEEALTVAAALGSHRGRAAALVGGQATNEEAFMLQRLLRQGLDSHDIDSAPHGEIPLALRRELAQPGRQASVEDIEWAGTVLLVGVEPLDDAPILDLRIRKGIRRHGVTLAIANPRPSALDSHASVTVRYAPGEAASFLDGPGLRELLSQGGQDIVVLWSPRIGARAAARLLEIEGAKLLEIPEGTNGRGIREAGATYDAGPGYSEPPHRGRSAAAIARAATAGEISALYLLQLDPVRELPHRALWEQALAATDLVVAHTTVLTDGLRAHADVVFPAETSAEKEGTVVHPDGRLQRLRAAIGHPGDVRATWSVIAEVARLAGHDLGILTAGMAWKQLTEAVPFYEGLTLEAIGGKGVRWPETPAAAAFPSSGPAVADDSDARARVGASASESSPTPAASGADAPGLDTSLSSSGDLRLGTYRSIWAAPEVEISPALKFTLAEQIVELAPSDAHRLGIAHGDDVTVRQNGTRISGRAAIRTGVPAGTAFLAEGIAADSANALTGEVVEVVKR